MTRTTAANATEGFPTGADMVATIKAAIQKICQAAKTYSGTSPNFTHTNQKLQSSKV
jgi:hypothetical protein